MKRSSTILLQTIVVVIGVSVLVFMLWEPHLEGRNVHSTLFEIYFKDPFLAYVYIASVSFFVALYQVFKLLGYIKKNELRSQPSVKALRTIKKCGIMLVSFVTGGVLWIILSESDDGAGGIVMGVVIGFFFLIVTAAATVFERRCSI